MVRRTHLKGPASQPRRRVEEVASSSGAVHLAGELIGRVGRGVREWKSVPILIVGQKRKAEDEQDVDEEHVEV